jgi:hypothetical protein
LSVDEFLEIDVRNAGFSANCAVIAIEEKRICLDRTSTLSDRREIRLVGVRRREHPVLGMEMKLTEESAESADGSLLSRIAALALTSLMYSQATSGAGISRLGFWHGSVLAQGG